MWHANTCTCILIKFTVMLGKIDSVILCLCQFRFQFKGFDQYGVRLEVQGFTQSFSNMQVTMAYMRARRSSKFGAIRPPTAELAALKHRIKKLHRLINGKTVLPRFSAVFFFINIFIQFNVSFKIISLIKRSQSIGRAKREYPGKTT